ncbi:glycoside hydrolase family 88 protein [Halioxenophilus aromaticivorans]|uniref:Uncharacterized protein n=1 Tax=Halioxenophilus aromaticivorans TaxID=1306992 RepID=A0AAV3U4R1_9ALTE
MKMIKQVTYGVSFLALAGCGATTTESKKEPLPSGSLAMVSVTNPSAQPRASQSVTLSLSDLGLVSTQDLTTLGFTANNQPVDYQWIDQDGDGKKDAALLMLDFAAAEAKSITLAELAADQQPTTAKQTHAEIGVKVGGSWNGKTYEGGVFQDVEAIDLPPQVTDHSYYLRYEGPGIESNMVGYRVYLDWRNGFDIFGKQSYGLHLDQVGQDGYDSYHELADWGMDILKVGKSVGAGGYGLWKKNAIERVSDVQDWSAKIIEDGNLYSAFAIDYQGWNTGDLTTDLNAVLSMQADSRLVNVKLSTDPSIQEMAVGLVKGGSKVITGDLDITGEAWSYMATLGEQALDGSTLAMFVLFQKEDYQQFVEDEFNNGVLLKVRGGELEYYFGASWGLEPGIDLTEAALVQWLKDQAEQLTISPRVVINNQATQALRKKLGGAQSALAWAEKAAAAEIARHGNELAYNQYDTMRQRPANWEYTMGMMTQAIYGVGKATSNADYQAWAKDIIDSFVTEDGNILSYDKSKFNIDSINAGKMLLQLYKDSSDERYRIAAAQLADQLKDHPRLDAGAFWHKQRYPYQLWLDGVYMGMPFLAEYSLMFDDGHALDEVLQEFRVAHEILRNPDNGLYYHAYDEKREQVWADKNSGLSPFFWSRGMGWFAMALADTYALLPESETEKRAELSQIALEFVQAILPYQTENSVWLQITDMAGEPGNYPEASGSVMFTYLLVKGALTGLLPAEYKPQALQAYNAIVDNFTLVDAQNQLHITQVCQVAGLGFGRDGSYQYYMSEPVVDNDPKALAPFMMLGPLVNQLVQ